MGRRGTNACARMGCGLLASKRVEAEGELAGLMHHSAAWPDAAWPDAAWPDAAWPDAAMHRCIYQAVQLVVPQMPGRLQLVVLTASVTLTPYTPPRASIPSAGQDGHYA